jgi:GNAT superfamily N-acetyltransferase
MPTTTADCETAVRVLVAAFADDPVARWLLPGSAAGAAEPPVLDVDSLPDELTRLRTFMTLTEQQHPDGRAHLYLVFLGVAPDAQGRGLGGELLRDRLSRADAAGVPAYLEASSPHSRPLYERHGFRVTGDPITLPDGPPLWPMWRDPRP